MVKPAFLSGIGCFAALSRLSTGRAEPGIPDDDLSHPMPTYLLAFGP
jgi:hypothetical protein